MAAINVENASIVFPEYTSQNRGLINNLFGFYGRIGGVTNVEVRKVRKYGLENINLVAKDGDRIGLVGGNGAGKTTLLKMLSGIFEPQVGQVHIEGSVAALTDITLGMDMEASGYENIATQGILYGRRKEDIASMVCDVASFTELGEYLNAPVRTYSSGMMLRLAFAIATARTPDIVLMDEMIGTGDQFFVERAQQRLQSFMGRVDIIFIASHSEAIIRKFCNRCLVIRDGRIIYDGDVESSLNVYNGSVL